MLTAAQKELRRDLARRLALRFDVAPLLRELREIPEEAFAPYSDESGDFWQGAALWAPGHGILRKDFSGTFEKRPAFPLPWAFAAVVDAFPGPKRRVRLLRQAPRSHAPVHADWGFPDFGRHGYRIHIPLESNPSVYFLVNRQRLAMRPGQAWFVNVCYPHEIYNLGRSARTHLCIDLAAGDAVHELLARSRLVPDSPSDATRRQAAAVARRFKKMSGTAASRLDGTPLSTAWSLATLARLDDALDRRRKKMIKSTSTIGHG